MAKTSSFDVSTGVDLQEVDNAVNQAHKEVAQRYDFKGTNCTMQFDRAAASVALEADDTYRLQALGQILREKLAKRKVPLKNLDESKVEEGSLGRARQTIGFKQGIDQETRGSRRTCAERASRRCRSRSRAMNSGSSRRRRTRCRKSWPGCGNRTTESS
jgi:uncharacterized protein YajQ (UPF0234 family)